jgi:hypothetical protein
MRTRGSSPDEKWLIIIWRFGQVKKREKKEGRVL